MSNPFVVGDVVVCVDDSPWAGVGGRELAVGKIYEVGARTDRNNVEVKAIVGWKPSRFRRAKVYELSRFRFEEGYEKHQFKVGDIVVGIGADDGHLGKTFEVSSVHKDTRDGQCLVGLDGDSYAGTGAYRFRKATPEEAVEFLKKPKVATFTAGEDLKEGQLVTIQIGDGKPFKAVLLDKPVDAVNGKFTVPAELTLSVSFEWEGPEPVKAPVTRPACAESITEAPKPKWSPKVGDWVKVKKPFTMYWPDKWPLWPKEMDKYDGLVAQVQSIVRGDRVRFEGPEGCRPSDWVGGGFYYHFDWLEPVEAPVPVAPPPMAPAPEVTKDEAPASREPTKTEHLLAQRVEILAERLRESLIVIKSLHTAIGAIGDTFKTYSDKSQGIVDEATEAYEDLTESLAEDFPEFFDLEDSEDSEDQS